MNRLALKPNSARGGSIGILFNKRRTSCLANPVGYGGILSSSEQQEQERNTHYTFFKLTIDGRQWLHFLSLTLKIICTRENENYEKLLATAPTAFMPHQPEEARQPWLAQPYSTSRNPRVWTVVTAPWPSSVELLEPKCLCHLHPSDSLGHFHHVELLVNSSVGIAAELQYV